MVWRQEAELEEAELTVLRLLLGVTRIINECISSS